MDSIVDFLSNFSSFSEKEKQFIAGKITAKKANTGTYIIQQGEICRKLLYLQKGAMVMVYEQPGKKAIRDFIFEKELASVYESFITQQPAKYSLKAISPCIYQAISYHDLQQLYQHIPRLNNTAKILTENVYLNMSQRFESLITLSAEQQYLALIERRPYLLAEVPQYMIASYLGITDVALSRIRKRISKKK